MSFRVIETFSGFVYGKKKKSVKCDRGNDDEDEEDDGI